MLFRRWVTQPLELIGESARALSIDDEQELPDFDSAELQEVVDAIRALQGSLAHERDRAVTAYRALEQSAVLALHVRSELADELGDPPPGWSVGSALVPADGVVAGDCFDLGLLDQHRLYVVMVDVTGSRCGRGTRRPQVEEPAARCVAQQGEPGRRARLAVAGEPQGRAGRPADRRRRRRSTSTPGCASTPTPVIQHRTSPTATRRSSSAVPARCWVPSNRRGRPRSSRSIRDGRCCCTPTA